MCVSVDAIDRAPDHPFTCALCEIKEFRLRGPVLQVNQRAGHRIKGVLLGEGCQFGGNPVVDHDGRCVCVLKRADHRCPVLHRELDIGDLGNLPFAVGGCCRFLCRFGDQLGIADLALHDVDLVVLWLPITGGFFVLQELHKTTAVVDFWYVQLDDVFVLLGIALIKFHIQRRRVAVQIGQARGCDRVHRGGRDDREGRGNRVRAAFDQRLEPGHVAFWREHVQIDDLGLKLASQNAPIGVDLFDGQLDAVRPVLVVCYANRS